MSRNTTPGSVPLGEPSIDSGSTDHAYARIRQAIVEGRHPPGGRLVEQRLAEELDVSRTPVREALKMLEAEGLVTIERNVGALVRRLDRDSIIEVYDLRARLEAYASIRAARFRSDADVAHLTDAASGFSDAVARRSGGPAAGRQHLDVSEINARNSTFHTAIVNAARSSRLGALLGRTMDVPLVFQAFRHFDESRLQRSALFHHLIAEAIEAERDDRAERLMIEHIEQGRDALLEAVDAVGMERFFRGTETDGAP